MRAVDLIELKRDGKEIPASDLKAFVNDVVSRNVPDYQAAAFLMAVYFQGMTNDELVAYTDAMLHSAISPRSKSSRVWIKVTNPRRGELATKFPFSLRRWLPLVAP